jgi:hypothetical protein
MFFTNLVPVYALVSGENLLKVCSGTSLDRPLACHTFVVGFLQGADSAIMDAYEFDGNTDKELSHFFDKNRGFCVPKSVTRNQVVEVFVSYLKETPKSLHDPAGFLLRRALVEGFPCNQ